MIFNDKTIDSFIKKYDDFVEYFGKKNLDEEINNRKKELNSFVNDFPIELLNKMELDDYVVGKREHTFCWYIDSELSKHGDIRGQTTAYQKYGIYYDKKNVRYCFGSKKTKKTRFGKTESEIFSNIRSSIIDLLEDAKNNNLEGIAINPLNDQFKNKITYLYYPKEYIPIYSDDDLNVLLDLFDIPFNSNDNRIYKRKKLFDFYKALNRSDMTTWSFMKFVYSPSGYRSYLRNTDFKDLYIIKKNIKYRIVDIDKIDKKEKTVKEIKKTGLIEENQQTIEYKKAVGKKGESIVKDYLNSHKKELGIVGAIECACETNDYVHYDFSFKTVDSRTIYIEVKSTKNSSNLVQFEMSDAEYRFMKENMDNYYIYYINNVYQTDTIYRIKPKDVDDCAVPSKYKISASNITSKL